MNIKVKFHLRFNLLNMEVLNFWINLKKIINCLSLINYRCWAVPHFIVTRYGNRRNFSFILSHCWLLCILPAVDPCFSLIILKLIVWSLGNFNTMLLTSLPNFWMTLRINKYGYRGVYSFKINSFKSLASYLGSYTRFRTIRHVLI